VDQTPHGLTSATTLSGAPNSAGEPFDKHAMRLNSSYVPVVGPLGSDRVADSDTDAMELRQAEERRVDVQGVQSEQNESTEARICER